MTKYSLFLFSLFLNILPPLSAQEINADRLVDWSIAGVQTDIPQFSNTLNILDYGGSNDGSKDNVAAFKSAIAAAKAGTTILFPSGNYLFNNSINISKDSIIIKGEGTSTRLLFNFGGAVRNAILVVGTQVNMEKWIAQPLEIHQDFAILHSTEELEVGQWVHLVGNDSSLMNDYWAYKTAGQILQIKAIKGDSLFFNSQIRRAHAISTGPRLRVIRPKKYVGIENLYIERQDVANDINSNMLFSRAVNSWVIGVESNKTNLSHLNLSYCSNITVRGSYFHHAHSYGNGGKGYGIMLEYSTNECLIENNVFNNLRHSVLFQAGSNGNVIAYNHSLNPYWTGVILSPSNSAGEIVLHGNYPYANLFEGNAVQQIVIDDSHGKNGSYNTAFRNKLSGYGFFMNPNSANSTNIIGNDITNTANAKGLYTLTGTDNFQYGNRVKGANSFIPAGTGNLEKKSYYLCTAPAWWNNGSWPNLGTPYPYNSTKIPAEIRWENGAPLLYNEELRVKNEIIKTIWYKDNDSDLFGDINQFVYSCEQPSGYVANSLDCDDTNPAIYPGAEEIPNDGIDQDCDGNDLVSTILPNEKEIKLKIFPNPSSGQFNIQLQDLPKDNYQIIITDINGKIIYNQSMDYTTIYNEKLININVAGIYFVKISGKIQNYSDKIIINH
ncbi:MAG: MopE-related protein [Chitinophagales bacterium]|nr:MopE-related protein [Chitinophagales bacterium]